MEFISPSMNVPKWIKNVSRKNSSDTSVELAVNSKGDDAALDYATLNVPEIRTAKAAPLRYNTRLDDTNGNVTREIKQTRPIRKMAMRDVDCERPVGSFARDVNFRYLGKEKYKGAAAYNKGRIGDADSKNDWIQILVRIFNPNSFPPTWGTVMHRFLIGSEEELGVLIDKLMIEEDAARNSVRLEYFPFPGNSVRLDPERSARAQGIENNSIFILTHRLDLDNNELKMNCK